MLKGKDFFAVGGLVQPARNGLAQHAATVLANALTRHNDDAAPARRMLTGNEGDQRTMRFDLGHAVQVKPCLDRQLPSLETLSGTSIEPGLRVQRAVGAASV